MSRIAPEVWARLGDGPPTGENLTARVAVPDVTDRLLAALDAEGQRHLLIALALGEGDHHDSESRGVRVMTRELSLAEQPMGRYLDIVCHDAAGRDAFDLVGGELAERLADAAEEPRICVAKVLARWRRFWGQLPRQLLSREAQLGLFAELWFLCFWLLPRVGAAGSIARWRGPFGARHDFEWPGRSVEVKATASTRGALHRINGLDQLAPPDQGELLFFSLRLRDEAGATNTLPELINTCRTALAIDDDALTRFEASLVLAGHSALHDEEYEKLRLRVVAEELFSVHGEFPRLTLETFSGHLPAGIERVEYEINLSGFEHLRLAHTSTEVIAL